MSQIKIYALREHLTTSRGNLSEAIHGAVVEALSYPPDKRAHRFFPLEREDFLPPAGRSDRYTIIEISMFEGRTVETKKRLLRLLFERLERDCAIAPNDVEVTIFETPMHNWGIRGAPADELVLNYDVRV